MLENQKLLISDPNTADLDGKMKKLEKCHKQRELTKN